MLLPLSVYIGGGGTLEELALTEDELLVPELELLSCTEESLDRSVPPWSEDELLTEGGGVIGGVILFEDKSDPPLFEDGFGGTGSMGGIGSGSMGIIGFG
jgi:hypothetical protein